RHRRGWLVSAILLSIGLLLLLAFRILGSTVDEQGVLHEPFPLLAIGSLFGLVGLGMTLLLGVWSFLRVWIERNQAG
ncbi:MAG: DUF3955 domain-containing protein, partial [Verrucomicrobiales bacterium]